MTAPGAHKPGAVAVDLRKAGMHMARRRSRYNYGHDPRYGSRRRSGHRPHRGNYGHQSEGHSTWWVWLIVIGAAIAWGSSNTGGSDTQDRNPGRSPGNTSTVCTEYFRGGC